MNSPPPIKQNCPSCGAATPPLLKHSKLTVCEFCHSTLFVDDAQVAVAGEKSVLSEIPSILVLGQQFRTGHWDFTPLGRIRYEYGEQQGYWDEWWVALTSGEEKWISNDEGEYVVQTEVQLESDPPAFDELEIGQRLELFKQTLAVTELNLATCIGIEGQLPEVVNHGDQHHYAHLEGAGAQLVTIEYEDESVAFYNGMWLDPFEINFS